jgi:hypothetical protein
MVFPLNHARRLIEPFVFRLCIDPAYSLPDGKTGYLGQSVTIGFRLPEAEMVRLHSMAGLPGTGTASFSVIGNAIPVANVDLKAWEPDATYGDFARTTNMKPLGFAGIVPYKQSRDPKRSAVGLDDQVVSNLPFSAQLSIEFNKDGQLVSRYALPGAEHEERQLLFWMTYGSDLNGRMFRAVETEQIQPMHMKSESLRQAVSLLPCYGGFDCEETHHGDLYESLMLSYTTSPQTVLFRDSLIFAIKDLLTRLGYIDNPISGPFVELRVVDGGRQRAIVVYIRNNALRPLRKDHIAAIKDYVDQHTPLGSRVVIEVT